MAIWLRIILGLILLLLAGLIYYLWIYRVMRDDDKRNSVVRK